jgi:hypothetical protein
MLGEQNFTHAGFLDNCSSSSDRILSGAAKPVAAGKMLVCANAADATVFFATVCRTQ